MTDAHPASWHELRLSVGARGVEVLSDRLHALGSVGLEELSDAPLRQLWEAEPSAEESREQALLPVRVRAWFPATVARDQVEAGLARLAAELPELIGELVPRWTDLSHHDWEAEARATFTPIVISERLTLAPPWDAPAGALILEPGQGFGTGDHPTTRLALRALEALCFGPTRGPSTCLDVGCGSGVLALAAARWGVTARGVDVQESAVAEALANAERNALSVSFSCEPLAEQAAADLVIANLHAELLVRLAPELASRARQHLVLTGILADRLARVLEAFSAFPNLRLVERASDSSPARSPQVTPDEAPPETWVLLHYACAGGDL